MRVVRRAIAAVVVLAAVTGAALVARPRLAGIGRSLRTSSSPGVRAYELGFGGPLGRYYAGIAGDCAGATVDVAAPSILEVGPGPGHLAVRLLQAIPGAHWTGLDIDPAMVAAARARLGRASLAARATCVEGDVSALPFADASFDLVVTSFSAHHWPDAAAGFAEIARVLRPGGTVLAYDLPAWWARMERGSDGLRAGLGFFPGAVVARRHGVGPVTIVERLEATRA
jgi:SAM-dependent methyltransferase